MTISRYLLYQNRPYQLASCQHQHLRNYNTEATTADGLDLLTAAVNALVAQFVQPHTQPALQQENTAGVYSA